MKDQLNLRILFKYLEEENDIALQISRKIESLHGLGRQAIKLLGFVCREFATFSKFPFGQFSPENSQTWLGSFLFSDISVTIRNSSQSSHVFAMGYT